MKLARTLRFLLLAATLSLAGIAAAQSAIAPIVIKFSHIADADTPRGKAALRFKQLVEQSSHGRLRVDVYPNGVLYRESDELEALQLGAVQMLAPSLAKLALFGVREFEVFDLPYLFTDQESVERVTHGAVGKSLLKKLDAKGMVGLAYWNGGLKIMSANKPINMPNDFIGLRMRIHASPVLDMEMDTLGATPITMDAGDVYGALKSGLLDGAESTLANFRTRRWYEVQSNVTLSNHGYVGYAVTVNKRFWESLPTDLRKIIDEAMAEATVYGNALAARENSMALEWLQKSDRLVVHVPTAAEKTAWRAALQPVARELESRIGRGIVMAAESEAEGRWRRR
ncbi:MAG TPA: DctP family TRAP transporter solute-binding subunit [Oxalicibacterium sp.]|nr:DctP family TRAP transporter solute-binding subunit [Oxalicibacterium sp.]